MIRLLPAAALGLLASATALHAEDPRLVQRLYDPGQVVRIEGRPSVQATIRFGDDELIENVAIGDSNAWQVTPNKRANLLFVKPLAEKAATNMTVVTNEHTYFFDLLASPKVTKPLYELAFTYPQAVKPAPNRKADASAAAAAPSDVSGDQDRRRSNLAEDFSLSPQCRRLRLMKASSKEIGQIGDDDRPDELDQRQDTRNVKSSPPTGRTAD